MAIPSIPPPPAVEHHINADGAHGTTIALYVQVFGIIGFVHAMTSPFTLFGAGHLAGLTAVAAAAVAAAVLVRRNPASAKPIRITFATLLIVNAAATLLYKLREGITFPHGLPLHLSDVVVIIVIVALVSGVRWSVELAYYWALTGGVFALLTPDLEHALPSLPSLQFFVSHGAVIVAVVVLVWGERRTPRRGSAWRAFAWLNAYAALIGVFNWLFESNYLYLRHKPAGETLLDYMGPWPVYLLAAEVLAVVLFQLLALPFRGEADG